MKRPNFFSAKPLDDKWGEVSNCVRLWRAVLDQVLQDLIYEGHGKEDVKAHVNAWEWVGFEAQEDFDLVCELADLDCVRTKKEIYNLMEKMYGNNYKGKLRNSKKIIKRKKATRVWR